MAEPTTPLKSILKRPRGSRTPSSRSLRRRRLPRRSVRFAMPPRARKRGRASTMSGDEPAELATRLRTRSAGAAPAPAPSVPVKKIRIIQRPATEPEFPPRETSIPTPAPRSTRPRPKPPTPKPTRVTARKTASLRVDSEPEPASVTPQSRPKIVIRTARL